MEVSTLQHIKKELGKFVPVIAAYIAQDSFKAFPIIITLRVLVSNMAFTRHDINYDFQKDVEDLMKKLEFLNELKKFETEFHFVQYIADTVDIIVRGNVMNEDFDVTDFERE